MARWRGGPLLINANECTYLVAFREGLRCYQHRTRTESIAGLVPDGIPKGCLHASKRAARAANVPVLLSVSERARSAAGVLRVHGRTQLAARTGRAREPRPCVRLVPEGARRPCNARDEPRAETPH